MSVFVHEPIAYVLDYTVYVILNPQTIHATTPNSNLPVLHFSRVGGFPKFGFEGGLGFRV